jgi:alpha-galactosidase
LDENWQSVAEAGFGQNGKSATAPGAWNDIELLQTGNIGMSADEYRMQLNLWAVLAAPLMLGNDVRMLPRDISALLANRDLIAVDQDPLGRQGKRVAQAGDTEVWAKPLADGSVAVAFFNKGVRAHRSRCQAARLGRTAASARSLVARERGPRQQQLRRVSHAAHVAAFEIQQVI